MRLSAIIPTHDRPDALRRCLESLQSQAIDSVRLEVVVVDDGSREELAPLVNSVAATGPVVMRCERQPLSGLNTARNTGAAVALGDVLAFLDDDTVVADGWAAAVCTAFDTSPCEALGGRVELGLGATAPDWLATRRSYLAEYDLGPAPRWIEPEDPVPVGANCAIRRTSFEQLGGFRPGLDRIAGSLVSNGDTEFFQRLRRAGGRLRYEPTASVIHCVPRERLTARFFLRRHYAQGMSDEMMLRMQEGGTTLRRRAVLVRWLTGQLARATTALVGDIRSGRGTIVARFELSYWAGRLKGAGMTIPHAEATSAPRAPGASAPP